MPSKPLCRWEITGTDRCCRERSRRIRWSWVRAVPAALETPLKHARECRTGRQSKEGRLGVARCLGKHGV